MPSRISESYERVRKVGTGSFGSAWLCRRKCDGCDVVVKILKPEVEDRARVTNEIKILKNLRHENITKFYEAWREGHRIYISMEYADGGDLKMLIQERRSSGQQHLAESVVANWMLQLGHALYYIHSARILHRDMKAANVFLADQGRVVKLGDFGISIELHSTADFAHTALGTPFYLSPEIVTGKKYNAKSDVWAAGVVLHELLTFHYPYKAQTQRELFQLIKQGARRPHAALAYYSSEMNDLLAQMLEVDTARRCSAIRMLMHPALRRGAAARHARTDRTHPARPEKKKEKKPAVYVDEPATRKRRPEPVPPPSLSVGSGTDAAAAQSQKQPQPEGAKPKRAGSACAHVSVRAEHVHVDKVVLRPHHPSPVYPVHMLHASAENPPSAAATAGSHASHTLPAANQGAPAKVPSYGRNRAAPVPPVPSHPQQRSVQEQYDSGKYKTEVRPVAASVRPDTAGGDTVDLILKEIRSMKAAQKRRGVVACAGVTAAVVAAAAAVLHGAVLKYPTASKVARVPSSRQRKLQPPPQASSSARSASDDGERQRTKMHSALKPSARSNQQPQPQPRISGKANHPVWAWDDKRPSYTVKPDQQPADAASDPAPAGAAGPRGSVIAPTELSLELGDLSGSDVDADKGGKNSARPPLAPASKPVVSAGLQRTLEEIDSKGAEWVRQGADADFDDQMPILLDTLCRLDRTLTASALFPRQQDLNLEGITRDDSLHTQAEGLFKVLEDSLGGAVLQCVIPLFHEVASAGGIRCASFQKASAMVGLQRSHLIHLIIRLAKYIKYTNTRQRPGSCLLLR